MEIPRKNGEDPYPMTDPAGAGRKMLTLNWWYIDGIHGTPYIAAPWILWVLKSSGNSGF
jgi:hypothetical protein